ncbi:MAG TPA: class I SAM-dependent methyltransferase [Chthoniobacterales bacterium]|jgi:SAM-dependent methyltransferase|nr:class I SAM-dependent methyltransferase [Chthoniobacterales bacterium]
MNFKDHFSKQAADYAKFRPRYPRELFVWLGTIAPKTELAWDCATGSGQAAVELAKLFQRVIATDASEKQVANAERHPRIEYRVATAEENGLETGSVDLVTVAQALHWFDLEKFYREVRRVLKPSGVIASTAYKLATVSPAIDTVVNRYYSEIVGRYWPAERVLVEKFEGLPFPFAAIETPPFEMVADWSVEQLLGYLRTWSATQRFMVAEKRDPLGEVEAKLRQSWGEQSRKVVWPLTVRVGKI